MQKWEYTYVEFWPLSRVYEINHKEHKYEHETTPVMEVLNELGREGWETVGMDSNVSRMAFVLKRPIEVM